MFYGDNFDLDVEKSYPTPFQNLSIFPVLLMSLAMQKHTPDTTRYFKRKYDYIVVGAGSAGCVVAARLSEIPTIKVLLLEAGGSPPLITDLPAAQPFFEGTDIYWGYFTEPQKYAGLGHVNRRVTSPTGKCVGGSSTVNGVFYVRGNHEDYNIWKEMGAHGWDWSTTFPYFLKAENNTDLHIAHNGYHSVRGPMTVGKYPLESEYEKPLKKAAMRMGYSYRDINGARQSGFAFVQGNIRRGQRVSTAKGYLVPNDDRPNLDIVTGAHVTKVLISKKIAWGVQFDFEGSRYEVKARHEVILSAGALKSPQILMLSGVGPRKTLRKFGIPVIEDLPVGKNFHDHPATGVNFYSTIDRPSYIKKIQNIRNIQKYINYRTGPLAGMMGNFGLAFLADNVTAQKCDLPEYMLYFFEGGWGPYPPYGLSKEVYDSLYSPYLEKATIVCIAQDLISGSRGYVSIRSTDPYDPPVIDPMYYKDRQDLLRVVTAMKMCYRVMAHPLMKDLGFRPFKTLMPGCEHLKDRDAYLECYAKSLVVSVSHQVGTATMGDTCDPRTVVDTHFRVKGIKGLRVVDASVIPRLPRANTNTPVIMLAEKASDIIKRDKLMYSRNTLDPALVF